MLKSLPGSMKTTIYPSEALLHCVSATVFPLHRCHWRVWSCIVASNLQFFLLSCDFMCTYVQCVHFSYFHFNISNVPSHSLVFRNLHQGLRNSGFKWRTQRVWAPENQRSNRSVGAIDSDRREMTGRWWRFFKFEANVFTSRIQLSEQTTAGFTLPRPTTFERLVRTECEDARVWADFTWLHSATPCRFILWDIPNLPQLFSYSVFKKKIPLWCEHVYSLSMMKRIS